MTDRLTPQTDRQHRIAQEAGNEAWQLHHDTHDDPIGCSRAYNAAYQESLSAQQAAQVSAAELEAYLELTRQIWNETEAEAY